MGLLLVGTLFAGCTLSNTPRRSLSEFREALLCHDADRALRYIDVDRVVDSMAKEMLRKYEVKANTPLEALGVMMGKEVAETMMPEVRALIREQLWQAIASPTEGGFFRDIRRASVWYLTIQVEGDTAVVEPRGGSGIRFKMARSDAGYWRIVEIVRTR